MHFRGFWVANAYRAELEPFTPGSERRMRREPQVRAILQIRAAGSACADPKSCAVGIMHRGCDERSWEAA